MTEKFNKRLAKVEGACEGQDVRVNKFELETKTALSNLEDSLIEYNKVSIGLIEKQILVPKNAGVMRMSVKNFAREQLKALGRENEIPHELSSSSEDE